MIDARSPISGGFQERPYPAFSRQLPHDFRYLLLAFLWMASDPCLVFEDRMEFMLGTVSRSETTGQPPELVMTNARN